jgi:hypothetical protein
MTLGTQDQFNDVVEGYGAVNIAPENHVGQMIVPALPRLVAVEADLTTGNHGRGGDTLTPTVTGADGTTLTQVTQDVPEGFEGLRRFELPGDGVLVAVGEPLMLTLSDTGKIVFWWKYMSGRRYSRGSAYFCGAPFDTNDFFFRTFGAEDPLEIVNAVTTHVSLADSGVTYRAPDKAEGDAGVAGLTSLRASSPGDVTRARDLLTPLGFTVISATDPVTQRPYAMALSETARPGVGTPRAWGLYLVDLSRPSASLCVAVPHTRSDRHCQEIAMRLWRDVPGAVLMMATAHRDTPWPGPGHPSTADLTYNTECLVYQAWTRVFGPAGHAQVQVHGFALSLHKELTTGRQVVVSAGGRRDNGAVTPIINAMNQAGLQDPSTTTKAAVAGWEVEADKLNADDNVQGKYAHGDGRNWTWVHIEHSDRIRDDATLRTRAADAVRSAWPF